jgi:hypothetical protein
MFPYVCCIVRQNTVIFLHNVLLERNDWWLMWKFIYIAEVPNSNIISCSNGSYKSARLQPVQFPAGTRQSWDLYLRMDGDTLAKFLHSGDPDVIQTRGLTSAWDSVCVTCKCYSGKSICMLIAYSDDLTSELSLLAECMSAIHWGSNVHSFQIATK